MAARSRQGVAVRPTPLNLIAIVGGVATSCVVVLGTLLAGFAPVVILAAGSTVTVPGWVNTSAEYAGLPHFCSPRPCGYAGEVDVNFDAVGTGSLNGEVRSADPIWVAVITQGDGLCGYFTNPPPPCPVEFGTTDLYISSHAETYIDFAALEFNFSGANNNLPAGAWSIVFVNTNPRPDQVTAASSVEITPSWLY